MKIDMKGIAESVLANARMEIEGAMEEAVQSYMEDNLSELLDEGIEVDEREANDALREALKSYLEENR